MTQRDMFFNKLIELRKLDPKIVIVSNDMGAKSLNEIKNQEWCIFTPPNEQLAVSMAIGLAHQGFKPYIYLIASFVTRAFEMIHLACSQNLPIKIVSVGAGLSYDTAGVTHHAINDLNALRTIPNMTILNCSSLQMAEYYAKKSLEYETPLYIRLDKKTDEDHIFCDTEYGWKIKRQSSNNPYVVISTGVLANYLVDKFPNVVEIYRFPFDEKTLMDYLPSRVISIEENYTVGGLGDSLSFLPSVTKIGLTDFAKAKPREFYWKYLVDLAKVAIGE